MHVRDFLREIGFIGAKTELALKHVNAYLMKKLNLKEKPVTRKAAVVEVWEKLFFKAHTSHVRRYLVSKGVINPEADLRLKDVNDFLVKKLKLKKNPIRRKAQIVTVWNELFDQLQSCE